MYFLVPILILHIMLSLVSGHTSPSPTSKNVKLWGWRFREYKLQSISTYRDQGR